MLRNVRSNAYVVATDDNVGTIAEKFTGSPGRYPELVGANLHKPLRAVPGLQFYVFDSLTNGERINVPATWVQSSGSLGALPGVLQTGVKLGLGLAVDQPTALADTLQTFLQMGATMGAWTMPTSADPGQLAQVLAGLWQYLNVAPNNLKLPSIDLGSLAAWLTLSPGKNDPGVVTTVEKLMSLGVNYLNAFGALPYFPWDRVPWDNWVTNFPKFVAALDNDPTAVLELLKFAAKIAAIPAGTLPGGNDTWVSSAGKFSFKSLPVVAYPPPDFFAMSLSDPAVKNIVQWTTSDGLDPTAVPWTTITDPTTAACLSKITLLQLQSIETDPCYATPGLCSPLDQFKKDVCSPDEFNADWCHQVPCVPPPPPPCHAKTCAQLGVTCGKADDGCGHQIDCGACANGQGCPDGMIADAKGNCAKGACPAGTAKNASGACVASASSSGWKWALGLLGAAALAVGGYAAFAGGSKRNPLQSRETKWHREQFPDGIEALDAMIYTALSENAYQREHPKDFGGVAKMTRAHAKEWAISVALDIGDNAGFPGKHYDPYWIMQHAFKMAVERGGEDNATRFGDRIAMQAMGHGVRWTDDNPDPGFRVPSRELY
jgi:hypothetical protein